MSITKQFPCGSRVRIVGTYADNQPGEVVSTRGVRPGDRMVQLDSNGAEIVVDVSFLQPDSEES